MINWHFMLLSISGPSHPKHSYDPMDLKPSFAAALITQIYIYAWLSNVSIFIFFLLSEKLNCSCTIWDSFSAHCQ